MKREPLLNYQSEDLYLTIANYSNNGRLYMRLETLDGEMFDDITVNLTDVPDLAKDEVFLNKTIDDNLKQQLIKSGLISDMNIKMLYNLGMYSLVSVNLEKLKEYDEKAFNAFEKYYNEKNLKKEIER